MHSGMSQLSLEGTVGNIFVLATSEQTKLNEVTKTFGRDGNPL